MSYGALGYGTSYYGGGGSSISVARAWASSTRSAIVELTGPAMAVDAFDVGDALNPATWAVAKLDALGVVAGDAFTVLGVRKIKADASSLELFLLEPMAGHLVLHRVTTILLRAATGALIVAPYAADFAGVVDEDRLAPAQTRRGRWRDLRNPVRVDETLARFTGTIAIDPDGDYATEEDVAVVRKGILRRLFTPRGGFKHLPKYGIGLGVKQPIPMGGDLVAFETEIERQVLQEPDVTRARASVRHLGRGVALIAIRTTVRSGVTFTVGARRESDGHYVEI